MALRALARVKLAAIERNVARLRRWPRSRRRAVRGGQGRRVRPRRHTAARAALAGGATSLAVATAGEAAELRAAGISAPLLVMGALSAEELPVALAAGAELTAWTEEFVSAVRGGRDRRVRIHVKFDTGMGRLGTRSSHEALAVADSVLAAAPQLELAGAMTHFATADGDLEFMAAQLAAFAPFADADAPPRARDRGPCRQQRRDRARAGDPLRHGPLRHRHLRL